MSEEIKQTNQTEELKRQVEQLSAENLLLRQKVEYERLLLQHREDLAKEFASHKGWVEERINKRLFVLSAVGIVVLVISIWSAMQPVRQDVKNRLDKEFAAENIKTLISDAAQRAAQLQAKNMMEGTLKPAIDDARRQVEKQSREVTEFANQLRTESRQSIERIRQEFHEERTSVQKSMGSLRDEYKQELAQLRTELEYLKQLRDIQRLRNTAIEGDVAAFTQLAGYQSNDESLRIAAWAQMLEVKGFYVGKSRISGVSVWLSNPDGTKGKENDDIPTDKLLNVFGDPNWLYRTKVASILGQRREMGVVEALLKAMESDPNLWVRKEALDSFAKLTGFRAQDVFDFQRAVEWWLENKAKYLETLKK